MLRTSLGYPPETRRVGTVPGQQRNCGGGTGVGAPDQGQAGGWQQPPQGWQQGQPPQGWQQPPQGQAGQYGPPPGWTPPGASPYGGEPPKHKRRERPWVFLALLVFLFGGCAVLLSTVSNDPVSGGSVSGDPAAGGGTDAAAGPTFQGQREGDTVAEAGQSITLDDLVTTATPLVEGQMLGTTAVLCSAVTIVNNGDDAASFNGGFDWKLQDPQGAARGTTLGGSDTLLSAGELAPGGTVSGDVCFNNSTGAPGQYAVIYEPAFSFSGDRAVWVNNR